MAPESRSDECVNAKAASQVRAFKEEQGRTARSGRVSGGLQF
jgi:hypothetical protein